MSGEDLYNKWRFAMGDEGVDTDEWERCAGSEANAWQALAETLDYEYKADTR